MIEAIHVRFLLLFIGIGAVLALYFAPTSQADPAQDMLHDASLFCTWVHNDPTPRGVYNAVAEFVKQGVSEKTATDTIAFAIVNVCPEYKSVVARTADMFAPKGITT